MATVGRIVCSLLLATLASCSLLTDLSGITGGARDAGVGPDVTIGPLDASPPNDAAAPDAAPPLPPLPADVPADCELLVKDDFAGGRADPRWSLLPTATILDGEVVLTEAAIQTAGGLTIPTPRGRSYTRVFARFDFHFRAPDAGSADGLVFFWSENESFTLGAVGHDLGICGENAAQRGYAFVLNTMAARIGLWDLTACSTPPSDTEAEPFAESQPVTVDVASDLMIAKTRGSTFSGPISMGLIRRVGFTAATGGLVARHAISNVAIYICP